MSGTRLLLVLALVALVWHFWHQHSEQHAITSAMDEHGFLPVPMPENADTETVLIFAPKNCPKEGAQKAAWLAEQLTARGIPNQLTSQYRAENLEPTDENLAAFKRLDVVMRGDIPITLVNGKGKANPSLEEVIAEYQSSQ